MQSVNTVKHIEKLLAATFPDSLTFSGDFKFSKLHHKELFVNNAENPTCLVRRMDRNDRVFMTFLSTNGDAELREYIIKMLLPLTEKKSTVLNSAINSRYRKLLQSIAEEMKYSTYVSENYLYYFPNDAFNIDAPIPHGHVVQPLREQDAELVNDTWKYKSAKSINHIKELIQNRPTLGLYMQNGGQLDLISWALCQDDGAIGMVQTLELHRRKGHSRIVAVHLARQVLELGFTPFCYINEPNVASIMLFKSLGFVQGAESDWIFLTPQDE